MITDPFLVSLMLFLCYVFFFGGLKALMIYDYHWENDTEKAKEYADHFEQMGDPWFFTDDRTFLEESGSDLILENNSKTSTELTEVAAELTNTGLVEASTDFYVMSSTDMTIFFLFLFLFLLCVFSFFFFYTSTLLNKK